MTIPEVRNYIIISFLIKCSSYTYLYGDLHNMKSKDRKIRKIKNKNSIAIKQTNAHECLHLTRYPCNNYLLIYVEGSVLKEMQ